MVHTIESILSQRGSIDQELEIVVVGPEVDRIAAEGILRLKTERVHPPGKMRNLGARSAGGEYLLFIDDDCRAADNWLNRNLERLSDTAIGAVTGRILGVSDAFFSRCTDYINYYIYQNPNPMLLDGALNTSTCAIRASLFEELGGFDERLLAVEDVDLGMRLLARNYKIAYDPAVVVYHHHDKQGFSDFMRHSYRMGSNAGLEIENRYEALLPHARFVNGVGRRGLYWLFSLPFAAYSSLSTLAYLRGFHKRAWLLLPFIFMARGAYQMGVLSWLGRQTREGK